MLRGNIPARARAATHGSHARINHIWREREGDGESGVTYLSCTAAHTPTHTPWYLSHQLTSSRSALAHWGEGRAKARERKGEGEREATHVRLDRTGECTRFRCCPALRTPPPPVTPRSPAFTGHHTSRRRGERLGSRRECNKKGVTWLRREKGEGRRVAGGTRGGGAPPRRSLLLVSGVTRQAQRRVGAKFPRWRWWWSRWANGARSRWWSGWKVGWQEVNVFILLNQFFSWKPQQQQSWSYWTHNATVRGRRVRVSLSVPPSGTWWSVRDDGAGCERDSRRKRQSALLKDRAGFTKFWERGHTVNVVE